MRKTLLLAVLASLVTSIKAQSVAKLKITILSTQVSDLKGMGEWGFSALVETDSTRILFDLGAHPRTVLDNASELQVDLSGIRQVVLSHNHIDHTAGLAALRQRYPDGKTAATVYIGPGFFLREQVPVGMKGGDSLAYVSSGGKFELVTRPVKIANGIYLTGPVPRKYPEKNYPPGKTIQTSAGTVEDNVAEDMSMVIQTSKGLVLLTGCGHAGIVNTLEYTQQQFPDQKFFAVVGGFHLLDTKDEQLVWTAGKLKSAGIHYFIGAHCTGLNSVYRIRELTGMPKTDCLIGTVGMTFDPERGISPGWMR